ncbi:MAG: hypothetical protein ACLU9S_11195 [Oscillospiraceae bacterium]
MQKASSPAAAKLAAELRDTMEMCGVQLGFFSLKSTGPDIWEG